MSVKFAAGVVGTLLLAGGSFFAGGKYERALVEGEHWQQRAAASDQTLAEVRNLVKNADDIAKAYESRERVIHEATTTILRETPHAITPETDARYPLSNGFVRMYDSAVVGALLPAAPGEPDDAPSAVTESVASGVNTLNLGRCREAYARVAAWDEWARTVTTGDDR